MRDLPPLKPGLYVVATPIGNLGDITLRALHTLQEATLIACEDTRVSAKLLNAHGIRKPLLSYHDHNADRVRPTLIQKLKEGETIALISDAGTPLISDPGYKLVQECLAEGIFVTTLPGPSSVLSSLILSGFPTDQFFFGGFVNKKNFASVALCPSTLIFFESAKRLLSTLQDMSLAFENRTVSVVREITKLFEETRRGTFAELMQYYEEQGLPKGEVVLVLSPPHTPAVDKKQEMDDLLRQALKTHSLKDACALVAGSLGIPKKVVYQYALSLKAE